MADDDKFCKNWNVETQDWCGATEDLRHFNSGWKCPPHTENAVRRLPEYPPGPGIPAYRECGECSCIQRDHTTVDPTKPGPCRACNSCRQFRKAI